RETHVVRAAYALLPRRVHVASRDRSARAPEPEDDLRPSVLGSSEHAARARQRRATPRRPTRRDKRPSYLDPRLAVSSARALHRHRRWARATWRPLDLQPPEVP